MPIYYVNTGSSPNSGDGDSIRAAFYKINESLRYISTITVNTNTRYLNIIPEIHSQYWIGNTSTQFERAYIDESIYLNNNEIAVNTSGSLTFKGIPIGVTAVTVSPPIDATTGTTWFEPSLGKLFIYYDDYWVDIGSGGGGGGGASLLNVDTDILPISNNFYDIGNTGSTFNSIHIGSNIYLGTGTITYSDILRVNGNPVQGPSGPQGPSGIQGLLGGFTYSVTASGVANWFLNDVQEPNINLLRGNTYYFVVNAPGLPFWIKSVAVTGTNFAYTQGITNNGVDIGTIQFTVPYNAPNNLFYISQQYGNMQGAITVLNNGQTGPTGPQGPSGPPLGFDQELFTTSSVIFQNLTVNGTSTFYGRALFLNTVTYVQSTNTFITDNLFDIHVPPVDGPNQWTFDDGQDAGIRLHYWGAITTSTPYTFTVTNTGTTAYVIEGSENPNIDLIRGYSYIFDIQTPTEAPFYIKTSPIAGVGAQYNDGVTNNGISSGTITFSVPVDAPSQLYYVNRDYPAMAGNINIIGDGNTGTVSALIVNNTSKYLEWLESGYETSTDFIGNYGTFKTKNIEVTNVVRFSDSSTQATAFIGTANFATLAGSALLADTATVALSVNGGTIVGSPPVNNTNEFQVGYMVIPQNPVSTNYILQLTDQGKHLYSTTATGVQTIQIPDSISVPFPIGSAVSIVLKGNGAISLTTGSGGVFLYLAGSDDAPSNRTLNPNGMATLLKVENNTWFINGTGIT